MNRPPTPSEALFGLPDYLNAFTCTDDDWDDRDCMQEALTAEWLIEQGLMPDPTEYSGALYWDTGMHWYETLWLKEDKTK